MEHDRKISVIGLGYVGLPVAVAFGLSNEVIGFDINKTRIQALIDHQDWTHETSIEDLTRAKIYFTYDPNDLKKADFHIVAVPSPIDEAHKPNLAYLIGATETVAKILKKGDIVVYESTVYPGATEEECIPLLEKISGLKVGIDFGVGYSPERINPGDNQHKFTNINKIVSGCDQQTLDIVASVYSSVIKAEIHRADSIKIAEAAKIIENTQRDLNIALMNELAIIFDIMGIDTQKVLDAANTKWNFLPFKPGLVGGHCIGVDSYYLTFKAKRLGYYPEVILAGRRINNSMGKYIAEQTIKRMIHKGCNVKSSKIAVLGLTFKEDCRDLRNSKVVDVINELKTYGVSIIVHDPIASHEEAKKTYGVNLCDWSEIKDVDAIVICVGHKHYKEIPLIQYAERLNDTKVLIDVKSILPTNSEIPAIDLWRL